MKEKYLKPEIEVIELLNVEILTESTDVPPEEHDEPLDLGF